MSGSLNTVEELAKERTYLDSTRTPPLRVISKDRLRSLKN
jgi:hypothetical protein